MEEKNPIKVGFAVLCVIPVAPVVASFTVGAHPEVSWKSALTNTVFAFRACSCVLSRRRMCEPVFRRRWLVVDSGACLLRRCASSSWCSFISSRVCCS